MSQKTDIPAPKFPRAISPRPSAAKRWVRCPAFLPLMQWVDDEPTFAPWLLEGTYAHKLAELCLRHGEQPKDYLGQEIACKIDEDTRFERTDLFIPDRNMVDYIAEYTDFCRDEFAELKARDQLGSSKVEERVGAIIHGISLVGTADHITTTPRTLAVTDLKFGENLEVFADDNEQAESYLVAGFNKFYSEDSAKCVRELRATIVQPRLVTGGKTIKQLIIDNPLEWIEEKKTKFDKAFGRVVSQQGESLIYGPSAEACLWCDAAHFCGKFKEIVEMIIKVKDFDVPDVDPEFVRTVTELSKPITDFIAASKRFSTTRALNGKVPRGMKLVEGGRAPARAWVSAPRAAKALRNLVELGEFNEEDFFVTSTPRTPTQVAKLIGDDFVAKYAIRPCADRPVVLVPLSDKRRPIATAKDEFADLLEDDDEDLDDDFDI